MAQHPRPNAPGARRRAGLAAALGLLVAAGGLGSACFSGADFSDCPQGDECGILRICVAGACVFPEDAPDQGLDEGTDAAPDPDVIRVPDGPINRAIIEPGKTVILGDHQVSSADFLIDAKIIEVRGTLSADGDGARGGLGGGGGGAGHPNLTFAGGEAVFAEPEQRAATRGQPNTGVAGGAGGPGGRGLGIAAGTPGAAGSSADAPDGQPGGPGRILSPADDACANPGNFQIGGSGGGGGGGRGGDARGCRSGQGGAAGGSGGQGGGVIRLRARERIVVSGRLSARGLPAPAAPNPAAGGGAACGDAELSAVDDPACDADCEVDRDGVGGRPTGDGPGPGDDEEAPGTLGRAGAGGRGGPGSGGTILLEAPRIDFEPGHNIDLSGGEPGLGAEYGGVLGILGAQTVDTNPVVIGALKVCTP